nr:MAG TPA: hypothetical protein [Bacteriophage sp.]
MVFNYYKPFFILFFNSLYINVSKIHYIARIHNVMYLLYFPVW